MILKRRINLILILLLLTVFPSLPFAKEISGKSSVGTLDIATHPPHLEASVAFKEPSGNLFLDAEEEGNILVTIKNTGKGDAFGVRVKIVPRTSIENLRFGREYEVGTVKTGGVSEVSIPVRAAEKVATATISLDLKFPEANGFDADSIRLTFQTRALEPPDLIVVDVGIDDSSGNGRIEPGELVDITARIQNRGTGDARGVKAEVAVGENVFLAARSKSNFDLGNIGPGDYKDITFSIYTNKRIKGSIPVEVALDEARKRFNKVEKLTQLAVNVPQKRAEEIRVAGIESKRPIPPDVATLSVDVDIDIPKTKMKNPDSIAVIIGNKDYQHRDVPPVDYAIRDASVVKDYLVNTLGYREGNIIFEKNATQADFLKIFGKEKDPIGKLYKWVKPGKSDVFIYYAGHGAPDIESKQGYFVPVDSDPQYVKLTGYPLDTFYKNLSQLKVKSVTVVIDACFSGSSEKGMLFKGISPIVIQVSNPLVVMDNATIITSASGDQVSTWYPKKKHSLFTYYFLKALKGEGDLNKDKKLSVNEIYDYINENVPYKARKLTGREQNPQLMGNKELILVEY